MTDPLQTPPNWPRLAISIDAAAGTAALARTITPVAGASLDDTRLHALEVVIAHAARIGRLLCANAHDPSGSWPLVIYPDARVEDKHGRGRRPLLTILRVTGISVASLVAAGMGVAIVKSVATDW